MVVAVVVTAVLMIWCPRVVAMVMVLGQGAW